MMTKYIIKNCPAFNNYCNWCRDKQKHCKDITDCILKKIYENLKQVAISGQCDNCDGVGYYNGCGDAECGMYQALKSIELLETEDKNE